MERLTIKEFESVECEPYVLGGVEHYGDSYGGEVINKLAEYEDLEEQGLLLRLPCAVDSTVYLIKSNGQIASRKADMQFLGVLWDDYGKEWFLTKEEAKQVLAEMKGV